MSGEYKGRIYGAFVFSFLKSMLSKAPIGLAFVMLSAFIQKTVNGKLCLTIGIAMVMSVVLQALCQHAADRLQSAAGFMIFADKRMELGKHLHLLTVCQKATRRISGKTAAYFPVGNGSVFPLHVHY